jgi:hypothetical protein
MKRRYLLVAILAACSGSTSTSTLNQANPCADGPPNDAPSACPSPPPTYQADVLPVLQAKCLICHSPTLPDGGANAMYQPPYNYSTYALQDAIKGTIYTEILTCNMPNLDAGASPMDEADRQIIMGWITCGALDN